MKITTTQAKLLERLEKFATIYEFDLVSEKLIRPRHRSAYQFMYQIQHTFKTVLGVCLDFYEEGVFGVTIGSEVSILPDDSPLRFDRIYPTQGDLIDEVLSVIETALQTFNDTGEKGEEQIFED